MVADEVDTGDVAVDAGGHRETLDLPDVLGTGQDDLGRNPALPEDELAAVDVIEEEVERRQALLQAGFYPLPGLGRDDPRDDVEGEDLLRSLGVRVHGKGDPVVAEHLDRQVVAAGKLPRTKPVELLVQPAVARSRFAGSRKHFVVEAVRLIAGI